MPNWSIGFDAQSANVRSQAFDASQSAASAPDCRQSIVANVRIGKHSCLACVEDARLRVSPPSSFTRLDADQTGTALSCPTIVRHSDPLIKRRIEQNLARIALNVALFATMVSFRAMCLSNRSESAIYCGLAILLISGGT
jgi:hypothetical protein